MEPQKPDQPSRRTSPSLMIGGIVVLFGILVTLLVITSGGSGYPAAGTPILDVHATNVQRTLVAENVLSPMPPARWTSYLRGRRHPTHDMLFVGPTLYVGTEDGLLFLNGESGEFTAEPDFPVEGDVVRLWLDDDGSLWAGLEDGQAVFHADGAWSAPQATDFPAKPAIDASAADICPAEGVLHASDGSTWFACPEAVVHLKEGVQTRYGISGIEALPGEPTGTLLEGEDGRIWIALSNGVAALEF